MPVQLGEFTLQRGAVLGHGLDVEAELSEEVPGQFVDDRVLDGMEWRVRELALDVVNDLLHGVDGLVPVEMFHC